MLFLENVFLNAKSRLEDSLAAGSLPCAGTVEDADGNRALSIPSSMIGTIHLGIAVWAWRNFLDFVSRSEGVSAAGFKAGGLPLESGSQMNVRVHSASESNALVKKIVPRESHKIDYRTSTADDIFPIAPKVIVPTDFHSSSTPTKRPYPSFIRSRLQEQP
ncbi:hypothetical protein Dda_5624 [Drechslerella dactyloides]|uniref:Uncharacterized protein n=1 Tax=Drechslerella dactyloides TaxID=74499 RepID=A0AAD6IYN6_DREDA|nr:hypothetical protein Dda_5624 [Drechslerella dactyloides]